MKQEIMIQLSKQQVEALREGDTLTIVISSKKRQDDEEEAVAQPREKGGSFFTFFQMQTERLRDIGKVRTSETYRAALNKLKAFRKDKDLSPTQINGAMMEDLQAFLRSQNLSMNSISFYAGGFAGEVAGDDVVWVVEAVVDVDEELSAGEQFAGGLFGAAKATRIINRSADIDINTLKAVDGFAGGEIGYVDHGEIVIGCASAQYGTDLATDIDITTMSGAYAMGGVIGGNTSSATLNLSTLKSGTKTEPAHNTIAIEVAGWENTKATDPGFDTYFDPDGPDSKSHKAGTISNVIGYMVGDMSITAVKGFDGEELFDVTDNLDADAKEAVGYKKHTDEQGNIPTGKAYWGDTHGYVGYGNAGYTINGKAVVSQRPDGFNLFKAEENYD